jgi:predicted lipid carrier protein YhbT
MRNLKPDWPRRLIRELPGIALRPLGFLPRQLSNHGLIALCNQVFAAPLATGELAFLDQQILQISVEDAGIELILSNVGSHLRAVTGTRSPDVCIRGTAYDLLLLVSKREDADSLFFQRRLRLEGDTELGLHLKNFLDAWEAPPVVQWFQQQAHGWLALADRFATADGKVTQKPSGVSHRLR